MHNNSRRRRNLSPFSERHKIETLVWDFISCWREHRRPRANQLNRFFRMIRYQREGSERKWKYSVKSFSSIFSPTMMMRMKEEKSLSWNDENVLIAKQKNVAELGGLMKWTEAIRRDFQKNFRWERNIFNLISKEFKLPALETWIITSQCNFVANCEKLILIFKLRQKLRARLFSTRQSFIPRSPASANISSE